MGDTIALSPGQTASVGGQVGQHAGKVSTIGSTIDTATQTLMGALSGAMLEAFPTAVDVLHRRIQISLLCAEDNLRNLGKGLNEASTQFAHLDSSVAALLANLENATPEFVGYEPPGIQVKKKGRSWWQNGLLIGGGILATVGGAVLLVGGAIGEVPTGGADTPVTIGGGALASMGVDELASVGAEDLIFTAAGEGGAVATASSAEEAIDSLVAKEAAGLDQELANFFNDPANVPQLTGAH